MKVLFLDVDGVLVTEASARYYRWLRRNKQEDDSSFRKWCPIATNNLRTLMARVPKMKIVLSSSWRHGRTPMQCSELLTARGLDGSCCIGRTGESIDGRVRGDEIQEWLSEHPEVTKFAILDDDDDMGHLWMKLVLTDSRVGITLNDNDKIAELLA